SPVFSYWINHSRLYREARIAVVSTEHYLLCDRAAIWLKPNPGTTAQVVDAVSAAIVALGIQQPGDANVTELVQRLRGIDLNQVESATGVSRDDIVATARLFVTGHLQETPLASAPGELVGSVVHTVAHDYNV